MSIFELEKRLLIAGLKELISKIEQTGVPIIVEPLNRYETHFINRIEQAVEICKEVGPPTTVKYLGRFLPHGNRRGKHCGCFEEGWRIYRIYPSCRQQPSWTGGRTHDFVSGIAALKSIGYDGWLTIESGASTEPEDALNRANSL